MRPGLLVLPYAVGIVWADGGGSLPSDLISAWSVAGLALCGGILLAVRRGRRASPRLPEWTAPALRGSGLFCVIGLFFLAGYDRLEPSLGRAASDRALAEAGKGDGVRLAQARVRERRSGSWGDEVELEYVRATDGGRRLPGRLLLRLDHPHHQPQPQPQPQPRSHAPDAGEERISSRADVLLWPGTWVRLGLFVRPLQAARNPGTPDREHREARRGYGARARLLKPDWVMALSNSHPELTDRVGSRFNAAGRDRWRRRVASRFEEEALSTGLVRALALGDRDGISPESREAFRRLGLSHLVAISGLHIGFIAGLAGWVGLKTIVWLSPRSRKIRVFDWALAFACCAAGFYAWLTDAGVSVERASLLFGLYALCRLALRRIAPASALGWVALAILVVEPEALFDVGAQLSFAACSALIAAGFWRTDPDSVDENDEPVSRRMLRMLGVTFRASLVVSLGTAPVVVQHGFSMSALSPLFNVVAIPWTGLIVLPSSLALVSLIEVLPRVLLHALALPAGALEATAIEVAGMLPEVSTRAWLGMPAFAALIGVGFFALRRDRWNLAMLSWCVASLAGASPISFERPIVAAPRVIFFDVGQGDAALIQGREAVVLVDTGPGPPGGAGGAALVRGLHAAGVRRIDVLVLTHGDLDHRAGIVRVLEAFTVDELWLPGSLPSSRDEALLRAAAIARLRGTRVLWQGADPSAPTRVHLADDVGIEVLWPIKGSPGVGPSRNENSLVLRVVVDQRAFLFVADIGTKVENRLIDGPGNLDAEILKVAHHGSRSSSSAAFLRSVSPDVAILSAPCDPTRGLPNGQALDRIRQSGAELWWTGRDGAITVAGQSGEPMTITGWGAPRNCAPR